MKYILRRKAFILSAFLVFIQLATPIASSVAYAASTTSNDVGSSASLDPVGNKATRLQTQGASGVDQSSGAFTYSYPLTIPEGRNGMAPKLTLSYNSQNNESGWFGHGWTMSIPYIERTTKTGTDKMYSNPAFVSSLHGEIISSNGISYEQKIDDGSYAKYTYSGNVWQMVDRDGTTYYFGTTYNSRVQDDTTGTKIGKWYITEVRDKFGNGIIYNYTKDSGTVYPSSISYTEHALSHPLNLVTFGLETKNDKLISYKYGFRTTDTKRVSYIKVVTNGRDNTYFTFNYTAGANGVRSLLQSAEEKHLSTNDDWTILPKTSFEYENSSTTFSGSISNSTGPYAGKIVIDTDNNGILELYTAPDGFYPIDINGDYKKDLVQSDITYNSYSSGRYVNYMHNQGGGTFVTRSMSKPWTYAYFTGVSADPIPPPFRYMAPGQGTWGQESVVTDVNGDGFDDIVYNNPYMGNGIVLNAGDGTFDYIGPNTLSFSTSTDQVIDMNSDGLQDKISRTPTSTSTVYYVYFNDGSGYSATSSFLYDAKIAPNEYDIGVRFVDINNDGLTDVLRSYTSSYSSYGNPTCSEAYSNPPATPPINQSHIEMMINNGSSFVTATTSSFSGYLVSYASCAYYFTNGFLITKTSKEYDTNGDMTTDYDGATNVTAKQDILKKVTSSLGATTDVTYTWTTQTGLNQVLPVPMHIVATTVDKLSTSDTNPHSVTYSFSDGKMYFDAVNPRDHKFAGFGKLVVTDGANKKVTYNHQGDGDDYTTGEKGDSYYNIGRPYRVEIFDTSSGTSTLVTKELSLYTTYSFASSSFTYLESQVSNSYNGDGSYLSSGNKNIYDESKRLIKTSYSYGDIEPFISFASSTIADKGTDLLVTSYEYSNTRPQRLVKQSTVDYSGKSFGDTLYYYDNLPRGLVDKGAVTSILSTVYNQDGAVHSTSTSQNIYDSTGNVTQTIDNLNHKTSIIYDSSYFFPISKIDALNGTSTFTYDPYTLNLLTTKGPDGIAYAKETDGLGKVTRSYTINNGGGASDEVRTSYVYGGGVSIYTRKLGDGGASARSFQAYDSYGRLTQSKSETSVDVFSTQNTTYDVNSNIISTSLPYMTTGYGYTIDTPTNGSTIYTYDGLGRVLTKSSFGTMISYQYGARSLTVQDNASTQHKKSYAYDANGNLAQVTEYNAGNAHTTKYNYTPSNKLSRITDANGNIRNFSYLSSGSLVYQEDPHPSADTTFTSYSYSYDSLGNLLSKAGPLGTTTYAYDALNRPTSRALSDVTYGTSTVSITYAGCSNNYSAPCVINRTTSSTTLTYNASGKLSSETLSIDGKSFARSYAYDTFSNPTQITYPDNGKTVYTYTLDGKQSILSYITPGGTTKNIVTSSTYNSLGALSSLSFGNGVQMCNSYTTTSADGTIFPKLAKSTYLFNSTGCSSVANQIELYKDEFTYKDSLTPGSILSTYKDIAGVTHTKSDTFTYDNLARLTQVSTSYDGGGAIVDSLIYDPIGNILKENDVLYRYSQDGQQNAHAVTSIGGTHISYDAQGNRIQVGDNAYAWNALNQMVIATSTNGTEFYTYDENGERIKKIIKATAVTSQKVTPSASSTVLAAFSQGDFLASVSTSSIYIATSTYNTLSSLSLLDKPALTNLVSDYYASPFTSKFCATSTSSANRQSCIATTTKQLLANNINSRSTSTVATNGLITDILNIVTGTYLIPSTYVGLATSSIAISATSTFNIDSGIISSYNTFVATGIVVVMAEYTNLPYVSSSTYASLVQVGLTDTSKVRALLTLSGCTSIITACATAKKVVFEKYYKENGYILSDRALQEMWYVFAAKARLPGNGGEFTATSTVLGSITVPAVSSVTTTSATSTYYSGLYFATEYTAQNTAEPRLQYFNSVPYYINQTAFNELFQAGITQTVIENYQALVSDFFGVKMASSTEYILALKKIAQYDKNVTLTATTTKELYLVVLGAAMIPNNINDYTSSSVFDLVSYLSVETVYGSYGSTLSNTTTGCNGGTFTGGLARCVIRVSPFSLPIATSSTVIYLLSVTAPNITDFMLNAGESINIRASTDNYNYGTQVPYIYVSRYSPATYFSGYLEYISGSISSDGFTQTIDVTPTIIKQKASSTEPANILLMNRSGWTNGEQYAYQSQNTVLKAYVNTPRLTLASTTLVSGVTSATSSTFTSGIESVIGAYFAEIYDSSNGVITASSTATSTMVISPEAYTEFASTTLIDSYAISKVFLGTSTPWCESNASTTECDKQARKIFFRTTVGNLSGFIPSESATEEFWMVHKGLLSVPSLIYQGSTTPGYYVSTTTSITVYLPTVSTSTLVAYYALDSSASSSIGSYHGTQTNSPTYTTGKLNNALTESAASSQYASLPNAVIPWGTNTMSVNMWVKMNTTGGNQSWMMTARTGQGFMLYKSGTNTIDCAKPNVVSTAYNWTAIDTNWHMWTCVTDGSGMRLYLDGNSTPVATNSNTSVFVDPSSDTLEVGAYRSNGNIQSSWYNDGKIDGLGIWSSALSTTLISNLYNSGAGNESSVTSTTTSYTDEYIATSTALATTVLSSPLFSRTSLPQTLATSTATTSINLALVPAGLLSDLQYNSLYATSTFALATSTKIVSEDTYNELLRTPVRLNSDVDIIFDYALPYATSTCGGQSATSSCVVSARKTKVKDTISSLSGFSVSDAALEELYKVKNNELSIVPISLAYATMTPTTQNIIVPISTTDAFTTFSTTTAGATTTVTASNGTCSFGTNGATTSQCYIDVPYISTTVSDLALSYTVSTSSVSTSTVTAYLTYMDQVVTATTTATSSPVFITTSTSSVVTAQKTATTTFTLNFTSLFQSFLNSSSSRLTLIPSANSTSTSFFLITNPILTLSRSVLTPTIKYASSSNQFTPFDRSTIPSFATTTATSTIDLTNAPNLDLSTIFLSPVGRLVSNSTGYTVTLAPTSGVTSFYAFNGDSNTSIGSLHGTQTNSPTYTTGKINTALTEVAASSQYVSLPNNVIPWGTNTYSVNMWVKMNTTGGNQSWMMTARTGQGLMLYKSGTNTIDCAKPNVVSAAYTWTGIDTNWHMWTCVGDSSGTRLYLDGNPTPVATNANTSVLVNPGDTMEVGAYRSGGTIQSAWYNDGKIDALGIWSTAISTTTIAQLYNGGVGTEYPFTEVITLATSTLYSGIPIDPVYSPHPTVPQQVLPAVSQYPYATSTATSSVYLLTVATTTQSTVYTPFSGYSDASSTVTTYFTLNGTLVGAYTYQKGNEASTGKLTFIHTNYLGTPALETNDKGDIVQMDITDVFGNYVMRDQRNDNAYHNKGFTSHEFDDVTGLTYAKARYLDTRMHSFLSVDPLLYSLPQDYLVDPQQMNSYAYARNNPIVYTDPTGLYNKATGEVEKGDTFSEILKIINNANKTNYTLSTLQNLNKQITNVNKIYPGQIIKPNNTTPDITRPLDSANKSHGAIASGANGKAINNSIKTNANSTPGYNSSGIGDLQFANNFREGGKWDLKSQEGIFCQQKECGGQRAENYIYNGEEIRGDSPGNIHYSSVGNQTGYSLGTLLFFGDVVQGFTNIRHGHMPTGDPLYDKTMIIKGYGLEY